MFILFLFAFFCSIIFAFVLTYFFKRRAPGPFNGILYFFTIIFLFTLAVGFLISPIGPMYKNIPWLSIITIGLLITLLIAELLPHHDKAVTIKRKPKITDEEKNEDTIKKEFGIILVIILVILFAAIIYAVMSPPDRFKMSF